MEWSAYRDAAFEYKKGDTWDRLVHQGVHLLERFAQDNRVRIHSPKTNLQIKILQTLTGGSEFVSYLDAIGEVDGVRCVIDWKTTTSRYPQDPEGLLSLDPQLICYSWISGIAEVALVVFVRKHAPEIVFEGFDLRKSSARIWSTRRDNHKPDRSGPLQSAQRRSAFRKTAA